MENGKFTAVERAYLLSLDAVEDVSESIIVYSDAFKAECMERYKAGDGPARIFREAGLDPKLVGYKRVERAIARWKRAEEAGESRVASAPATSGPEKRERLAREVEALRKRLAARERQLACFDELVSSGDSGEEFLSKVG